ncbi:MAG: response regulator [Acidobacteriota bacterium]|nr:response regulator [Acidobacteriota bacterium]
MTLPVTEKALAIVAASRTPVELLIVEHSPDDVELMLLELNKADVVTNHTIVEDRRQFCQAISDRPFDAVLSDFNLPTWTGMDALRELRVMDKITPFLLVTGTLGEEAAVECIKQGVSDFVLKEHMVRLPVALRRAIIDKRLREENVQALEALRASEAQNRELVHHTIFGICNVDAAGTIHDANPALLLILGCDSQAGLGKLSFGANLFRFPEQYARIMAQCRETGSVHGAEAEWRKCDGRYVNVRLHLRFLYDPLRRRAFEVIVEDVTEFRTMERQLRQAQKFEAIGQLAGGIAHDFNNVIGAILGWAELGLDQNRANPETANRFERIREQAERAAGLTRELLAFARKQVLQPQAVNLNDVTAGLLSFIEKVIPRNIVLKFVSAPLEPVKADLTQMDQVLMNLCLNARDAMPNGGRLTIETEMIDLDEAYCRVYPYVKPGRYAVLSTSDTGIGMNPETRDRIFEPFFTTKEVGKGTGLGLATVYGIVKQHHGFIQVYSEPAQGSLFRIYLPVMTGADGITPQIPPAPVRDDLRGSETVLFAEDHESLREMAYQTLTALGYRMLLASDGDEALQMCENETPALAILDVIMPQRGGPATAEKLHQKFPGLPVLHTSGYSPQYDESVLAASNAHYLQKPYSPRNLARLVRQILDQSKMALPAVSPSKQMI